jgi:hypothetical protein
MNLQQATRKIVTGRAYMGMSSRAYDKGNVKQAEELANKAYNCFLAVPHDVYFDAIVAADAFEAKRDENNLRSYF